jgi:hypothetical protein
MSSFAKVESNTHAQATSKWTLMQMLEMLRVLRGKQRVSCSALPSWVPSWKLYFMPSWETYCIPKSSVSSVAAFGSN